MWRLSALIGAGMLGCTLLGAVLGGGAFVERARPGASNSERAADLVAGAALLLMLMAMVLLATGWMTAANLALAMALFGGVVVLVDGRAAFSPGFQLVSAGLGALGRPGPLWAVGLLGAWLVARMLRWPDTSWDALTYHLTYPAVWLQQGRWGRFEAGGIWDQYESFPKGAEALFLVVMAPFRSDALVGVVNLVFWAATGAAVKGTAQRLGCTPRAADVVAALALSCPALSAYVAPAYVEVPSAFAFAVALNAGVRVMLGDPGALAPLAVALGLAASFKTTGLALWPFGLIAVLAAARVVSPRELLRHGRWSFLAATAVGSLWYAANGIQCGNPLYPAPLPGATEGAAAGSLASAWAIAEGSVVRQAAVGTVVEFLAAAPWRVPYPLGPGWLYLLALPGCVGLGLAFARREAARAVAVLSGLAVALLLLYLVSPWNGLFVEANTRFLAPSLIAALLGCAVALRHAPPFVSRGAGVIAGAAVLLALGCSRLLLDPPGLGPASLIGAMLAVGLAGATIGVARSRRAGLVLTAAACAVAAAACPAAWSARVAARAAAYAGHAELHPIKPLPRLWALMDSLPPSRVAFVAGGVQATEGWFFYPLFGADLRHRVRYVDVERDDRRACLRRGRLRDQPDEHAWLERLHDGGFDYLVTSGDPIELRWALGRPEAFAPVLEDGGARLFAIDLARLRLAGAEFARAANAGAL